MDHDNQDDVADTDWQRQQRRERVDTFSYKFTEGPPIFSCFNSRYRDVPLY